jgi:hypothetical protein
MSMTFKPLCPHCGIRARVRTCKRITTQFTELYCNCPNCGSSWRGSVEVINFINPPMRSTEGHPIVKGHYQFDDQGALIPATQEAPTIPHSRGPSEMDKRQMPLALPMEA